MVEPTKVLRRDLDRAVSRIIALEQAVFGRDGNDGNVEAVRAHLKALNGGGIAKMSPAQVQFIRNQLPREWLELSYVYGHEAAFTALAHNFEIADAREKLSRGNHA